MFRFLKALGLIVAATTTAVQAQTMISLDVRGAQLSDVVSLLAQQSHSNIIMDGSVPQATVTIRLVNVSLRQALQAIESAYALSEDHRDNYIVLVPAKNTLGGGSGSGTYTVHIDIPNGNAVNIATQLAAAGNGAFVSAVDPRTIVLSGNAATVQRLQTLGSALGGVNDFGMETFGVNYRPASEVFKDLQGMGAIPTGAQIFADDSSSHIFVAGGRAFRSSIHSLIAGLDVPIKTATFEVTVLDVQPNNDSSNRGIIWGQPQTGGVGGQITITPGSAVTSFAGKYIPIGAQINQLITQGQAQILATPRVTISSNHSNDLQVGANYPIPVQNGAFSAGSVQYYQVGVLLHISAIIGSGGDITASVKASYSDILGVSGQGLPIISNRSDIADDQPMRDGEPLVISGLYSDTDSDVVNKVPALGDVPLIGQFFRNRARTHRRDELVFILTPHLGAERPSRAAQTLMQGEHH